MNDFENVLDTKFHQSLMFVFVEESFVQVDYIVGMAELVTNVKSMLNQKVKS
jgi:hypothetical protein